MISTLVDQKKKPKKDLIVEAAYELFLERGYETAVIDDIVRRAGVAKGTFYLYFHDRAELLREIVGQKYAELVRRAYHRSLLAPGLRGNERILRGIEELVDEFARNPKLLALIHSNLTWDMVAEFSLFPGHDRLEARPRGNLDKLAFIVTELVTSVSYSAIILGEPAPLAEMKPFLLTTIRTLLAKADDLAPPREAS